MNKISLLFCILIYSAQLYSQENNTYNIKNVNINSKHAEFGVKYLDGNTILFSSSMKNQNDKSFKKGRRSNNRQQFLDLYIGNVAEDGEIINHRKFTDDANNKFADGDITLSSDRKTAYFIWNNFYNTQRRLDSANGKQNDYLKQQLIIKVKFLTQLQCLLIAISIQLQTLF